MVAWFTAQNKATHDKTDWILALSQAKRLPPRDARDYRQPAQAIAKNGYAQPVCDVNFVDKLPAYETGISKFLAADTSHSFPEDRSLNESIRIAKELAKKITL